MFSIFVYQNVIHKVMHSYFFIQIEYGLLNAQINEITPRCNIKSVTCCLYMFKDILKLLTFD